MQNTYGTHYNIKIPSISERAKKQKKTAKDLRKRFFCESKVTYTILQYAIFSSQRTRPKKY